MVLRTYPYWRERGIINIFPRWKHTRELHKFEKSHKQYAWKLECVMKKAKSIKKSHTFNGETWKFDDKQKEFKYHISNIAVLMHGLIKLLISIKEVHWHLKKSSKSSTHFLSAQLFSSWDSWSNSGAILPLENFHRYIFPRYLIL